MYTMEIRLRRFEITVFAGVVVFLGYYSHFTSAWTQVKDWRGQVIHPHQEVCQRMGEHESCPSIAIDYFFISVISISLLVCVLGLFLSIFLSPEELYWVEVGSHALASNLLLIGATLYLIAAKQISNLHTGYDDFAGGGYWFRTPEKYAAAAITYVQAVGHYNLAKQITLATRSRSKAELD